MRILSFDIEEWYFEREYYGARRKSYAALDSRLDALLDLLDQRGVSATFFCLGAVAKHFPEVVRRIHARGHEIGSHSFSHTWLWLLPPKELKEDIETSIDILQQTIGERVTSFRAPAFSITKDNTRVFELLSAAGVERDASLCGARTAFGGLEGFAEQSPCLVEGNAWRIKEFPLPVARFVFAKTPYSGGGYLRFFPYKYVAKQMRASDYSLCYLHVEDLLERRFAFESKEEYLSRYKQQPTLARRVVSHFKRNVGKHSCEEKLVNLLSDFEFCSLRSADGATDWTKAPRVRLQS